MLGDDCLQCCSGHVSGSSTAHMLPKTWAAVCITDFFLGSLARSMATSDWHGHGGSSPCRSPVTSPLMGKVNIKLFFSWLTMLLDDTVFIFYHAGACGSQPTPAQRGSELMAGVSREGSGVNEVIKD